MKLEILGIFRAKKAAIFKFLVPSATFTDPITQPSEREQSYQSFNCFSFLMITCMHIVNIIFPFLFRIKNFSKVKMAEKNSSERDFDAALTLLELYRKRASEEIDEAEPPVKRSKQSENPIIPKLTDTLKRKVANTSKSEVSQILPIATKSKPAQTSKTQIISPKNGKNLPNKENIKPKMAKTNTCPPFGMIQETKNVPEARIEPSVRAGKRVEKQLVIRHIKPNENILRTLPKEIGPTPKIFFDLSVEHKEDFIRYLGMDGQIPGFLFPTSLQKDKTAMLYLSSVDAKSVTYNGIQISEDGRRVEDKFYKIDYEFSQDQINAAFRKSEKIRVVKSQSGKKSAFGKSIDFIFPSKEEMNASVEKHQQNYAFLPSNSSKILIMFFLTILTIFLAGESEASGASSHSSHVRCNS